MAVKKGGLGKGLDALFMDNSTEDAESAHMLSISDIEPNRDQPRKQFDDASLKELADSIAEHGVIQPLLVRPIGGGIYQIVAGERRWRASRLAGLTEVPAVVRELSDSETMEIALVENLQREDLDPIEEAEGIAQLIETYSLTQEAAAQKLGKSRPAVANALRLLHLPQPVREMIRQGKLTQGHARALLSLDDPDAILSAAQEIAEKGLSVREAENLAKEPKSKPKKPAKTARRPVFIEEAQLALTEYFGRPVKLSGGTKGKIELEYYSEEDLAELTRKLEKLG
ncbi:MAG TPA: ParB/RepB/Spo0J family partition protein [Candidatus Onthovicinus excrementipullorum]|nr:ParB/RepB/Spo0J family partition protein [Candidatus Onthovicinus excrementipullorum]